LAAAILTAALVKPVLLTYVLIFLLEDAPWIRRAARIGTTLALAAVIALAVAATGGAEMETWRRSLDHVVFGWQTGVGFLDDMARLGLRAGQWPTQALWAAFAGVLCLAGLSFVEARRLDDDARLWVAVALAQFANPRLMDYDLIMLGPGIVGFAAWASPQLRLPLWRALLALCSVSLILNLAELTAAEIRIGPALLALFILVAAGLETRGVLKARSARLRAEVRT
jgi:hypothetical protein